MGNNLSLKDKETIFRKLVIEYELLKSVNTANHQLFSKILEKYNSLTQKYISTLDLSDIDLSGVDGVIKTDTFTLIGWNDENEDIDLAGLEETLKRADKKDNP